MLSWEQLIGNQLKILFTYERENLKIREVAGKIIPLHSKFTEPANDAGRDTEVLYGQKGKEVRRAELV